MQLHEPTEFKERVSASSEVRLWVRVPVPAGKSCERGRVNLCELVHLATQGDGHTCCRCFVRMKGNTTRERPGPVTCPLDALGHFSRRCEAPSRA